MDGPYELNLVFVSSIYQFLQLSSLGSGVGLAPACTVVGVVLGTEHIGVHLILTIEIELAQTVLVAPGIAIEALDDATVSYTGIVGYLAGHYLWLAHNLCQGLYTIEGTAIVVSGNNNLLCTDIQVVGLCLCRNEFLILLNGLIVCFADDNGGSLRELLGINFLADTDYVHFGRKECYGICIGLARTDKIELLCIAEGLASPTYLLWEGRDGYGLAAGAQDAQACQEGSE